MDSRKRPTRRLITELLGMTRPNGDTAGRNNALGEAIHHGLHETPLDGIYPVLNFDELVMFATGSWRQRNNDYVGFVRNIQDMSVPEVFKHVLGSEVDAGQYSHPQTFNTPGHWLNSVKQLSPEMQQFYNDLNPFSNADREERLSTISEGVAETLFEALCRDVYVYGFSVEERHDAKKRPAREEAKRTGRQISFMSFQHVFPRKNEILQAYAEEINRIMGHYSQTVANCAVVPRDRTPPMQIRLF